MSTGASDRADRDVARERRSLLTRVLVEAGELQPEDKVTEIDQLEGGWSRWSHVARARSRDSERRYVIRVKAPFGLFDTDLVVEYELFRMLEDVDLPTPRVFGLERSPENPFGGEFFVMEFLPGHAPNLWRARDHAALRADWDGERSIATDLVADLAQLHNIRPERVPEGVPVTDFSEHVAHWRKTYEDNRMVRDPVLEEAFAWLTERVPADVPLGLVHGDFRIGNTLIEDGRVTAVLDWELAYVGDVRFDLGYFALEYTAGRHLRPKTSLMGGVADGEWFLSEYERLTDLPLDREVVRTYGVLGLASLIAMTAVGVRRYAEGKTTDIRRVWARFGVPGMREELAKLMEW
jgi:aminoglycoside phosphotransferase (APT) family kinase protein